MQTLVNLTVFVEEVQASAPGVTVQIERLAGGRRIALGRGVTDGSGSVEITVDWSDAGQIASRSRVPMRVVVSLIDRGGRVVHSVSRTIAPTPRVELRVGVTLKLASESGLIPLLSSAHPDWQRICRELTAEAQTPEGRDQICMLMGILGIVSRLDAPDGEIEGEVAERLAAAFGDGAAAIASHSAREMLERLEECRLPIDEDCMERIDFDRLAMRFLRGEDPLFPGLRAAAEGFAPDPETTLGPQQRGWVITRPFYPSKDCEDVYIEEFPDGGLTVLAPPTVNLITAWDPVLQSNLREGHVPQRRLVNRGLNAVSGWDAKVVDMFVEVGSDEALLAVGDDHEAHDPGAEVTYASTGHQVLAVNVEPGKKITVTGANFIADTALVVAEYRTWDGEIQGILQPSAQRHPAPGLSDIELTVHGEESAPAADATVEGALRDRMVFEWPESASTPGLYSLRFVFANDTGHPTSITHGDNCETVIDHGPATSQVIHFVVLPPLGPRSTTVEASLVECESKMHLFYDNVQLVVTGTTNRFVSDGENLHSERIDDAVGEHTEFVSKAPKQWEPMLMSFPSAGAGALNPGEMHVAHLAASHLPHKLANILVAIVLFALFLVAIAIILWIIIGVIIAVIVVPGLEVKVIAAIIGGSVTMGGALIGLLGTAMWKFHSMVVAGFGGRVMGSATFQVTGLELAHLTSRYRFHRAVWPHSREDGVLGHQGMEHDWTDIAPGRLTEVWRTQVGGGDYYFTLDARRQT